ncbi:MAG: hypothetical protein ACF8XB_18330 [Planctomycetota bacterium JB042]
MTRDEPRDPPRESPPQEARDETTDEPELDLDVEETDDGDRLKEGFTGQER